MRAKAEQPAARRRFLKTMAVAATGGAVTALPGLSKGARKRRPKIQYGMLIDMRKCIGCQACAVACKAEFDVPLGVNRSWVEYVEKGLYPAGGRSFLPRLCNHCSDPPCVRVCPTGATYKREQDGVVVVDSGVCIGCKYCVLACPYGSRFLNPVTRFADKCDFCIHRVEHGLVPACVNTCVGGARLFGNLADPESEISQAIARNRVSVLHPEMGTQPNVYYIAADHTSETDAQRPESRGVRRIENRKTPVSERGIQRRT